MIDAANVDLKAFSEHFYQRLTLSHLQPVLDTLAWLRRETNVWLEITNLVIPQANDGDDEFRRMCDWILAELGDRVPLHFTAFHPDFRLRDRHATPPETLLRPTTPLGRPASNTFTWVTSTICGTKALTVPIVVRSLWSATGTSWVNTN